MHILTRLFGSFWVVVKSCSLLHSFSPSQNLLENTSSLYACLFFLSYLMIKSLKFLEAV